MLHTNDNDGVNSAVRVVPHPVITQIQKRVKQFFICHAILSNGQNSWNKNRFDKFDDHC